MQPFVKDVDFLFIYEVRNREIDSICLLWAYLESKGYRVGIINTWDSMFHRHPEYRTKVAVLSACYTDGAYAYFTGHALKFEKVVNLQWEQLLMNGAIVDHTMTDWDFSGMALKTKLVSWGEKNREYMHERFGIDRELMRVCGYLPLDYYREEFRRATPEREELFARYGLDPGKKTLLFISSFADIGKPEAEVQIMEGDEQENAESIRLQQSSQEIIVGWFRKLAREEKDLQIIYRPHPAEADSPDILEAAREIPNFFVIGRESIRNWVMNCDILCNWQSTSMIELYASGKKTLVLRPTKIPFKFTMPIFEEGRYRAAATYEELAEWIRDESTDFPIEKEKLLEYYSMTEEPVYARVGNYLIDILKDPEYHSPDNGRHLSAKGRILVRAKTRTRTLLLKLRHALSGGGKDPEAEGDYEQACYYEQKMKQNRIAPGELRRKVDALKQMMKETPGGEK